MLLFHICCIVLLAIGVTFFLRGWELTSNRTFRKFEEKTLCTNVPLLSVTFPCCLNIPVHAPKLHEETVFEVFSFHPAEPETLATIGRLSGASFRLGASCNGGGRIQSPQMQLARSSTPMGQLFEFWFTAVYQSRFVLLEALVCSWIHKPEDVHL